MTTIKIDIQQAQVQLMELLALSRKGVEVVLTEAEEPVARLVPVADEAKRPQADGGWPEGFFEEVVGGWEGEPLKRPRVAGLHEGAIWTSDDFDEPLDKI